MCASCKLLACNLSWPKGLLFLLGLGKKVASGVCPCQRNWLNHKLPDTVVQGLCELFPLHIGHASLCPTEFPELTDGM